ncbi:hypothetical protein DWY77_09095 [Megamonas rupellensis]|uniref:Uncharacterized protein n=1 Tax=Megamonas rupellensis TaxID=491921 RepID=A0A412CD12_9FIRM|nr:hypothetical protein [Megamonas rupellensis]RGQ80433.1 hypothetical protein DWY77_09095 [Megamonas rupellensis]
MLINLRKIIYFIFIINIFSNCSIIYAHDINYKELFPNICITEQKNINITNDNEAYIIIGNYIPNNMSYSTSRIVSVISFNKKSNKWDKIYYESNPYWYPKVNVVNLLNSKSQQFIISDIQGSGGFLTYKVIGYVDNNFKTLLERKDIFQGNYTITPNNEIIESMGHQDTLIKWHKNMFSIKKLDQEIVSPIGKNDIRLKYTIDDNHHINIPTTNIHLKVGQKLQLQRINTGVTERILYSNNKTLLFKKDYVQAIKPGNTYITIIPDGYDSDNQVIINVNIS